MDARVKKKKKKKDRRKEGKRYWRERRVSETASYHTQTAEKKKKKRFLGLVTYISLETRLHALVDDPLNSLHHPFHPSPRPPLLALGASERQERHRPKLRLGRRLLGRPAWSGGYEDFVRFEVGKGGRVGREDCKKGGQSDALGRKESYGVAWK